MIHFFDKYVKLGLKPIPIYQKTKTPIESAWNQNWSVERWRHRFATGEHNMGILLGDIVDVEADSEEANDLLERIIDGCPRPRFRSSKSIHNLFINPDPSLTRIVVNGIEFRGNLHQSVVPPSHHEDGSKYMWLSGSVFPIPEMPDELKRFYFQNKNTRKIKPKKQKPPVAKIKDGFLRTTCNGCKKKFHINKTRLMLEVRAFKIHGLLWLCRYCKSVDVREDCRNIRKTLDK